MTTFASGDRKTPTTDMTMIAETKRGTHAIARMNFPTPDDETRPTSNVSMTGVTNFTISAYRSTCNAPITTPMNTFDWKNRLKHCSFVNSLFTRFLIGLKLQNVR